MLLGLALMVAGEPRLRVRGESFVVLDAARFVQGVGGAASWAGAIGVDPGAAPREQRGQMIGTAMGAAIAGALSGR